MSLAENPITLRSSAIARKTKQLSQSIALHGEGETSPSLELLGSHNARDPFNGREQGKMEQQWIEAASKGDKVAFGKLVTKHLPAIHALAKRMLGSDAEAEDIAQDVLIGLWRDLSSYDCEKAQLSTWIYRITSNRCIDTLRKRRPDQLDDDFDQPVPEHQENELFNKQLAALVGEQMDQLPPRQKLALILFHYNGHSLNEIADIMESSSDAVESLLARARRQLKKVLSNQAGTAP